MDKSRKKKKQLNAITSISPRTLSLPKRLKDKLSIISVNSF
ncbi:MAG: hypothetical protein ACLUG8_11555 [[Eubacterium] siraeum]